MPSYKNGTANRPGDGWTGQQHLPALGDNAGHAGYIIRIRRWGGDFKIVHKIVSESTNILTEDTRTYALLKRLVGVLQAT